MDNRRRVIIDILVAVLIVAVGTAGFVLIEGWSLGDALFMTITSVTTVGYGEVHPLSPAGRAFAGVLIICDRERRSLRRHSFTRSTASHARAFQLRAQL